MRLRFAKQAEDLSPRSMQHPLLAPGDRVLLQNQTGVKPTRWDRSGVVVEVKPHDQHMVKVDGSSRVTLRNRQFLRKITPIPLADTRVYHDVFPETATGPIAPAHPASLAEAEPTSTGPITPPHDALQDQVVGPSPGRGEK